MKNFLILKKKNFFMKGHVSLHEWNKKLKNWEERERKKLFSYSHNYDYFFSNHYEHYRLFFFFLSNKKIHIMHVVKKKNLFFVENNVRKIYHWNRFDSFWNLFLKSCCNWSTKLTRRQERNFLFSSYLHT